MELHKPYPSGKQHNSMTREPIELELEKAQKLKEDHLQRLHEGTTKILIRERPVSTDRARLQAEALKKVDYQLSTIYEDLLENKGLKYYKNAQGMIEIGE